jgi:hypothetical protein
MKNQNREATQQNRQQAVKEAVDKKPKIKDKNNGYIHHILLINRKIVDSVLGDDPSVLFKEVDNLYYEHLKKIYNGKLRKGSEFNFQILRTDSNTPHQQIVVHYTPGSTSKTRFRKFDNSDSIENDFQVDYEEYSNMKY